MTICSAFAPVSVTWAREGILFTDATAFPASPSPDGLQLAILFVSPDGGTPESKVHLPRGEWTNSAQFLPGGRHLLFTVATGSAPDRWDRARIVAQDLVSGERTVIRDGGRNARYVSTGHLVYAVGGSLFGIAFDPRRLRTEGGAVPIVEGVMQGRRKLPGKRTLRFRKTAHSYTFRARSRRGGICDRRAVGRIEPLHPSVAFTTHRVCLPTGAGCLREYG